MSSESSIPASMKRKAAEPEAEAAERKTMRRKTSIATSAEQGTSVRAITNPKAMSISTARVLCQLNTKFYQRNATSFSQTRNTPWEGWRRCMEACGFGLPSETASDQAVNAQMDAGQVEDSQATLGQVVARHPSGSQSSMYVVLDLACGNLRFESFLASSYPQIDWSFFAVDNCEPLVATGQESIAEEVHFICEDIVSDLIEGLSKAESVNLFESANTPASTDAFDLVVSFGFMHHIPSFKLRLQFLFDALSQVKPGGYLVVSFWQFLNDEAKRQKIEQTHAEALAFFAGQPISRTDKTDALDDVLDLDQLGFDQLNLDQGSLTQSSSKPVAFNQDRLLSGTLESNDYFLGWKNQLGNYRYCHHFSSEEIKQIIKALAPYATVVESFSADGKTGNLNRYVVLCRRG